MTIKTTGLEFKRFYNDKSIWGYGVYYEEEELTVDGIILKDNDEIDSIPDSAKVALSGGVVYLNPSDTDGPSMEKYFRMWKKKQDTEIIVCEVKKDRKAEVEDAIRKMGIIIKSV